MSKKQSKSVGFSQLTFPPLRRDGPLSIEGEPAHLLLFAYFSCDRVSNCSGYVSWSLRSFSARSFLLLREKPLVCRSFGISPLETGVCSLLRSSFLHTLYLESGPGSFHTRQYQKRFLYTGSSGNVPLSPAHRSRGTEKEEVRGNLIGLEI